MAMVTALALFGAWASNVNADTSSAILDENGVQIVKSEISVRPLDLSRIPTTEELMAAGQLGGILYPTHQLRDQKKSEAARLDFGKAIEEWNKHNYTNAIVLFEKHIQQFPDSPWAAEATLHIGCDATYNGRYTEAEAIFTQLIANCQGNTNLGAIMMLNKARQRLALVKVEENNLDEASSLFRDLESESPDWKQRTYAAHWLLRLSQYTAAREALVNCGANALAYVLEKEGNAVAASRVRQQIPQTMRGHSLAELVKMAESEGLYATAIYVMPDELAQVPLPAVIHISEGSSGDKGHYWVLDKMRGEQLELFDPQSHRRFHQTLDQLTMQWSGKVLMFSRTGKSVGRQLDLQEMSEAIGGCCGVPAAPSNLGNDPRNNSPTSPNGSSCGAPIWSVNMVNMNFYAVDTPMWYDPPIGPSVRMMLSYNSQSSIAQYEPFGSKWTFAYGGYLVMDTSGTVTIFMPDGRMDVYTPNGAGGFNSPYRDYNTLTLISPNHYKLVLPDGTVYVYSIPAGTSSQQPFLTEIDDAYGQKLTLGYNSSVQLITITDAQGKVFTLSYNASGLVMNVADPFGRNASFQYDAKNNLIQITDMGGYWSSFTYNTNVFMTSIADARGTWNIKTEPADGIANGSNPYPPPGTTMWQNYRVTVTNPQGQAEEYQYDGYFHYSWFVSPRDYIPYTSASLNNYSSAAKTLYTFTTAGSGNQGEISRITYPAGDYIQYGYNTATGDRTSVSDSHGYTWHYTYNSMGLQTSVTDAKGNSTSFNYAANGFDLLSISNGLGAISTAYNSQHSLISLSDQLTNTTTFAYNSFGQVLYQVDALGVTNQYSYDASNRLSSLSRAGQALFNLTFDTVGRVQTSTDATGLVMSNNYNNLNQVVRVTYPDGKFESYVYSTCCPHIIDSVTDRNGRTVNLTYDVLKRLVQVVNPEGGVVQFVYDANGNKTNIVDPNGNVTSFTYDLDNRLVRELYADGKGFALAYDQGGFLTARTNAQGKVTFYTFDANHNLLTTLYSDGTPGVTNSYDLFNRLVLSIDALGTNTYSYDANSRLTNCVGPWANASIAYTYDALNRQTNLSALGSQPVGYTFDALNRLTRVGVGNANYFYGFSGANPLVRSLNRPNGSYTTYQYDGLNRLLNLANNNSGGQVLNSFSYTYNAQDMRGSETVSNGVFAAYAANQLVTNNFNGLNQLLASSQSNQVFSYDADGNMTRGCTPDGYIFASAYDAENRLKSLTYTNGSGILFSNQYIYNGSGLLAQLREYQNGSLSNDTRFIRSGYLIIQERDSNNALTSGYTWGLNAGGGIGGLLDLAQAGQSYSYINEGNGNVSALLDATQTPVASYAYDPFGVLISSSGTLNQPFQFATKRYDPYTGLIDFGLRQYLPSNGRWLSRDPIGEMGGLNLYTFTLNSPPNYVDPDGRFIVPLVGGIVFVGGVVGGGFDAYHAWQCGGDLGNIGLAFGRGFVSGAAGSFAGFYTGLLTANPWLGGAAGGAVGGAVSSSIDQYLSNGQVNGQQVLNSAGTGILFGGLSGFIPTVGRVPGAGSTSWGPNSWRLIGREGYSDANSGAAAPSDCPCSSNPK